MSHAPQDSYLIAAVVEWNHDRSFGFLEHESRRVFLHIRDFSRWVRPPQIGDLVRFKMGRDEKGRPCAVEASYRLDGIQISIGSFFLLALLLVLPAIAVKKFAPDLKMFAAWFSTISIFTFVAYYFDKKRAISGRWRVPEAHLHLLELLGGWPAAFLSQRCLRHKTSKKSYKFIFWLIVLLHQYIALDSLQHWKFTKAAISFTRQQFSK